MGWSVHHPIGLIHSDHFKAYHGYTLITTYGGNHATLIDLEGRICHRWQCDEGINYAYLLPSGNLLCRTHPPTNFTQTRDIGGASAALVELDWESNMVWSYRDPMLHHDYVRQSDGNTLALLWNPISACLKDRVRGGRKSEAAMEIMLGDLIREVAPDGTTVREWELWKNLDPVKDVICPLENRIEWGHANSLSLTSKGDFIVSFRNINTVCIVNRQSGEYMWKWGPGQVSHQHGATLLGSGRILVFDNGSHGYGLEFSRVLEVNPRTYEISWEFKGVPPMSFYSFHVGGAERQPNGNTLICEGATGRIFEVTENKEIVWEYVNPFMFPHLRTGDPNNLTFRVHRYGSNYSGLRGKNLQPSRFRKLNRFYSPGSK